MIDEAAVLKALRSVEAAIEFRPANHTYYLRGMWVPGVSSIKGQLDKPALTDWKVRSQMRGTARAIQADPAFAEKLLAMPDWELKGLEFEADRLASEHARLGTEVHALIEAWARQQVGLAAEDHDVSDKAHFLFDDFLAWAGKANMKVLAPEMRVASAKFSFAGTLDLLSVVDDSLCVWDWKTKTGALYAEERLQLAAYRYCVQEATGIQPIGRVLRIPKDGSEIKVLDPDEKTTYQKTLMAFLALRSIYDWMRSLKAR